MPNKNNFQMEAITNQIEANLKKEQKKSMINQIIYKTLNLKYHIENLKNLIKQGVVKQEKTTVESDLEKQKAVKV